MSKKINKPSPAQQAANLKKLEEVKAAAPAVEAPAESPAVRPRPTKADIAAMHEAAMADDAATAPPPKAKKSKAKKEEAPAAPAPSLVEGSLTPATPAPIKKKRAWAKHQIAAVLAELAFKGAMRGHGYALGNVLTAEGTVRVEEANIEERGIDLEKITAEVLAQADEQIETRKANLASLIVQVGKFMEQELAKNDEVNKRGTDGQVPTQYPDPCSAKEGHFVGLAEFLGERIAEVDSRVIAAGWQECRKTHPMKKGPTLAEITKKKEEAETSEASEASEKAPASKHTKKEKQAPKEKAPPPEKDAFGCRVGSQASLINACVLKTTAPFPLEAVVACCKLDKGRVKSHLAFLVKAKRIVTASLKGGVAGYSLPENKGAKPSKPADSKPAKSEGKAKGKAAKPAKTNKKK